MQQSPPAGRGLTGPQIAVIIVVTGLVLTFAVMLLGRLGATGSDGAEQLSEGRLAHQEPAAASSSSPAADDESPQPAPEPGPEHFASPSGNIVCAIGVDSADCIIRSFEYEPADVDDCPDGAGGYLRVEPAGASMPCDSFVVAGGVPELDYGEELSAHGYTCSSERSGVTCRHDESGYGFAVARAGYDLF